MSVLLYNSHQNIITIFIYNLGLYFVFSSFLFTLGSNSSKIIFYSTAVSGMIDKTKIMQRFSCLCRNKYQILKNNFLLFKINLKVKNQVVHPPQELLFIHSYCRYNLCIFILSIWQIQETNVDGGIGRGCDKLRFGSYICSLIKN